jgi:poly-gamma-glutamate capsule biosynthesis protein CapA/YwtB (metallophosphatase superfamily)
LATSARQLTVVLAGDVMTGRGIDQVLRTPSDPRLHEGHVRDARDCVHLAKSVDGSIGCALPDDAPWPDQGSHYRMHPANVDCLGAAGLWLCTLADNQVLDWGVRVWPKRCACCTPRVCVPNPRRRPSSGSEAELGRGVEHVHVIG